MNTKMPKSHFDLTFDPEKHQYHIGKKRIPGVSEILAKVGLSKDFKGVDPFYRDRGIATHLAIKYHLEGRLDPSTLDPAVIPHFEAFLAYWRARSEVLVSIEKPMASIDESFAGTPDLVTDRAIYDWKCSKSHDPVAELQGQAYKILTIQNWMNLKHSPTELGFLPFIVVELHDDGEFKEFQYGDGYEQWASVLDLYRWRMGK